MSVFLTRADSIAAYLATVDGLQSMLWVVDRQRNLEAEMIKVTGKVRGLGVITWMGGKNEDRNLAALRIASRFHLTLFFKPVVREGLATADDVAELTARALHHWFPTDTPTKMRVRFEVTDLQVIDHPEFYVLRIVAESVTQLSGAAIPIITPP